MTYNPTVAYPVISVRPFSVPDACSPFLWRCGEPNTGEQRFVLDPNGELFVYEEQTGLGYGSAYSSAQSDETEKWVEFGARYTARVA